MPEPKDPKPIRYAGAPHRGPQHSTPYPASRMAPAIDLVDVAREIAQADVMVNTRVSAKLEVIAEQIRNLQAQAREVLEEAARDRELHRADCRFKRVPGRIYHLYRRTDGSSYFSMLSPGDWGGRPPHSYIGAYRLEADLSWTPAEQPPGPKTEDRALLARLLEQDGRS